VKKEMQVHRGPARVFSSDQEGYDALRAGTINKGDVLVIRYEGVVGAPGMKEVMLCSDAIFSMNLDTSVGLVTDGRFSGFNRGPVVGHVSPEAALGGPLAAVEDGDLIEIDIPGRALNVLIPEAELRRRLANWRPQPPKTTDGVLRLYAATAAPPEEGAAMQPWAVPPPRPASVPPEPALV